MDDQDESRNVEDARDSSGFQLRPAHGIGLGGILLTLAAAWIFGINPLTLLGLLNGTPGSDSGVAPPPLPASTPEGGDAQVKFVSQVLRSTEVVWGHEFQQLGRTYEEPKLVLFRDSYPTGCGEGEAAAGPFYCPNDRRVYLDLGFFDLMTRQLGSPGQFAHAYVVGHEVGHHVQNLLGIVRREETGVPRVGASGGSVRMELQADCFAGLWARRSQSEQGWRLEPGDIESALHAASEIGDDTLQRRARGTVVPESFTHGTSAQRVAWFRRGFDSGSLDACDTFSDATL